MAWNQSLSPDVIAKLQSSGDPMFAGLTANVGNGQVAQAQWSSQGGEGGSGGPMFGGYSVYTPGQTNPGQTFGQYDTNGNFQSQQAFGKQGGLQDAIVPLAAALTMGTALPALGVGAGLDGAAVAGNAAAMTVPTEAAWNAGADALGSQLSPYLAAGAGAAGGAAGGLSVAGNGADMTVPTFAQSSASDAALQSSLAPYATGLSGASGLGLSSLGSGWGSKLGLLGLAALGAPHNSSMGGSYDAPAASAPWQGQASPVPMPTASQWQGYGMHNSLFQSPFLNQNYSQQQPQMTRPMSPNPVPAPTFGQPSPQALARGLQNY